MIPYLLILFGVLLFMLSLIGLLRCSADFLKRLEEVKQFFSSDAFSMLEETRRELDELNFSYYEILERQDERISGLETRWTQLADFGFFDFGKKDSATALDAAREVGETSPDVFGSKRDPSEAEELRKEMKSKVLALHAEGRSAEEIAGDLDIGIGVVKMICSIYSK